MAYFHFLAFSDNDIEPPESEPSTSLSSGSVSETVNHQTVGESFQMSVSEPFATSQKFDVGDILHGKVKLADLSQCELHCYLKQHSIPKESDSIRQEVVKGTRKKRKYWCFSFHGWKSTSGLLIAVLQMVVYVNFVYYFHLFGP